MKRFISTILILCLTLSGIAMLAEPVASAAAAPNNSILRLNHEDIEQLVRRGNPIIQNNRMNERNLSDMTGSSGMAISMVDAINQIQMAQAGAENILAGIMRTPSDPNNPDFVREGIIMSLNMDIASMRGNIDQMTAQLEQMQSDPVQNAVSRGVQQINAANRQIIWGVESLYLGYHTLSRQLEQTRENLETLNRNIEIMERRHAVGHVTARALQNVRATRMQLEAAIASMENELENLKGQLNLMLGRNFDATIIIGAMPSSDRDFLSGRDAGRDLRSARANNSTINIARIDMEEQARQGSERAMRQESIARNTLESEERALEQRFESLTRTIKDRLTTLELAEEQLEMLVQTLEETQRRFDRGMVSRVDLEAAKSEVALQEIRVASADAELFGAIRRYEWFTRGLNI